ncbi:beta strand repeat-containing protein [Kitasatospora kifunensis]
MRREGRRTVRARCSGAMKSAAALVAPVLMTALVSGGGVAQAAGTASVTISPTSSTVPSGTGTTYTLTVSCSVTGGCDGTAVSFPSTSITGDGSTTDFGAWVGNSSCAGVTKTASGGVVTFTYGNIPTGTLQCTFPVVSPGFTTVNGTDVTITPTISGSNFPSATAPPASMAVTATHNVGFGKGAPSQVGTGAQMAFSLGIGCGIDGSVGTSSVSITDQLPTNFTYSSYSTAYIYPSGNTGAANPPGTITYDPATRTLTYSDPSGTTCQQPAGWIIYIIGTAASSGTPDPVGSTIANTATAAWTYLDGTTGGNPSSTTTDVVSPVPTPFLSKGGATQSFGNSGQYVFPPNGGHYPYTYPGNWNGTGQSAYYNIALTTTGTAGGADFAVKDPVPCLNNFSGQVYSSPAPGGPYCTSPAFIPTLITPSGFTPTAADSVTVIHTDGSTASVPYTAGTGWLIPTSPAVAEIDFPAFPEEGSNSGTPMYFSVLGYAAATVSTTSLETNTATATAYLVGSTTPLVPQETSQGSFMVVSPSEPSGTVVSPDITSDYNGPGSCVETVHFGHYGSYTGYNLIEVASAPSQAIYIDYLAPAGATITGGQTNTFALGGINGTPSSYTTAAIAATATPNYNGTGRTLLQWVIPAGTITQPGDYSVDGTNLTVNLGAGCDGTYQNDLTVGYGAAITGCLDGGGLTPPSNPTANNDLQYNGTPLAGNYCGYSAPLAVAAVNPAFSVDKSVQGNLDPVPVTAGGTGVVSPSGGSATYKVTFTNTGQANLTNPVMYDILPAVGDTDNTNLNARGSQFGVSLTGVGPVPAGVTVYYSTSTNPCRPEILPSDPGCVNDWSTTAPSALSTVTALKFLYTGTIYVSGAGTSTFSVPYTVSAPSNIPVGDVAWDTVGTTADAGTTPMTPAESSTTGLKAAQSPLTLVKTGDVTTAHSAGDVVHYSFAVTNNTAVTLTNIGVTDTLASPAGPEITVTCPQSSLTAGASETCTASPYTVTPADIANGAINNSATASGNPPTGSPVTSTPSTWKVTIPTPALNINKSVSPSGQVASGQVLTYTIKVTNPGAFAYNGAAFTDHLAGVLDQGTLTGAPSATAGTVTQSGTDLNWSGDVPAGGTVTITYQVTVK